MGENSNNWILMDPITGYGKLLEKKIFAGLVDEFGAKIDRDKGIILIPDYERSKEN